jgi:hypothetical protein
VLAGRAAAGPTGNLPPGVRYVPTRACTSHVAAIAPDGTTRCVTTTPAAQKVIDDTLRGLGVLGPAGLLVDMLGLPFTGVDVAEVVLFAILAVGFGFVLWTTRRTRRSALAFTDPL